LLKPPASNTIQPIKKGDSVMAGDEEQTYQARCMCGSVELRVTGTPVFVGYCHCGDCRAWLGAPVHAATLWPRGNVEIVKGKDNLVVYKHTERSHRTSCKTCGGHILADHPGLELTDVLASTMAEFQWAPMMHIFYGEKMIAITDGLPKYANMPEAFGGDGKEIAE
jgi:hypothetical protein